MTDEESANTIYFNDDPDLEMVTLARSRYDALLRERDAYQAVVDAARKWKTLWDLASTPIVTKDQSVYLPDGWAPDKGPELDLWKALDALDAKGEG